MALGSIHDGRKTRVRRRVDPIEMLRFGVSPRTRPEGCVPRWHVGRRLLQALYDPGLLALGPNWAIAVWPLRAEAEDSDMCWCSVLHCDLPCRRNLRCVPWS